MFNAELKEAYISETGKEESTATDLRYKFNKAEKFEIAIDRDLSTFSVSEIVSMYKGWYSGSVKTLNAINSNFLRYTDFCLSRGLLPDSQNHYLEMDTAALSACVFTGLADQRIVTREQLLDVARELQNPSDAFLILALFEGIRGDSCCDLYYAEESQIEGNIFHCWSGRDVKISDELIEFARRASAATEYIPFGDYRAPFKLDPEDKRIIKRVIFAKRDEEITPRIMRQRMFVRVDKVRSYCGLAAITTKSLPESGCIDMVNRFLDQEEGDAREIIIRHFDEIKKQYGIVPSVKAFIIRNQKYLHLNKGE